MQNMLRTIAGMLAGAALVILIMVAAGVRAQDGGVQTLAGAAASAQTTVVDGVLATNTSMQYQGVLLDPVTGQPKPDGTYSMTFRIYNTGGSQLWQEQQSVPVVKGMFSVLLGAVTPLDQNIFNGQDLTLGVTVAGDLEMVPRQPLARVPYAFQALSANTANTATSANTANTATSATSASTATQICGGSGVCKDYRNTVFAYGIVGSGGSMVNGFHLGSSSLSNGTYQFRLKDSANTDVNYDPARHVVEITPYCDDAGPAVPVIFAISGQPYVYVRLFALNGSLRSCAFSAAAFYVY